MAVPTIPTATGRPDSTTITREVYRISNEKDWIHTDAVYNLLISSCAEMEDRLAESMQNYQEHPDVQANLQQLQYDLQAWNLALTTMTNINKNMADALNSIASNMR